MQVVGDALHVLGPRLHQVIRHLAPLANPTPDDTATTARSPLSVTSGIPADVVLGGLPYSPRICAFLAENSSSVKTPESFRAASCVSSSMSEFSAGCGATGAGGGAGAC